MRHAGFLLVALLLNACGQSEQSASQIPHTPAMPFQPTGDVKHLMQWVLDPAADQVWGSSGSIITAAGTQDLTPTTDAGWLAAQHSAAVVAESGNLLLMPGLARDRNDWQDFSLGLVAAGQLAMSAAAERNAEALFDAGGQIYRVCSSCHAVYIQGEESPGIQGPEKP